ncbi:MAG: hypothetical protein OXG77_06255 [Chloroflexi bacterium]|nr:hypothetical protein [Chloroflexota bacterium]
MGGKIAAPVVAKSSDRLLWFEHILPAAVAAMHCYERLRNRSGVNQFFMGVWQLDLVTIAGTAEGMRSINSIKLSRDFE